VVVAIGAGPWRCWACDPGPADWQHDARIEIANTRDTVT
jgi:hypothetical protein